MDKTKLFLEQNIKSEEFKRHSKNFYNFTTDKEFTDLQKMLWNLLFLVPTDGDNICMLSQGGNKLIFAFTDMTEFDKWRKNEEIDYKIMDYDELHNVLGNLGAVCVFNCYYTTESELRLSGNDMKNLYKIRLFANTVDADYIIGIPSVIPVELINSLTKEFDENLPNGVKNCYCCQCAIIGENSHSLNYVFVIDSASKVYLYLEEICYSISKSIETKYPVIFAHSSSDLGQMVIQSKIPPFYSTEKEAK